MSTTHMNLRLSSPILFLASLGVGCTASTATPNGGADPDAFTLDEAEVRGVHAPTGLGLAVGALGARLDLNGAEIGFHTLGWGDSQGGEALEAGDLELLCETPEDCDRAVAVHHAGLSEVWEVHPSGFEQSWVVDRPRGDDHQLVVEIAVEGASLRQLPGQTAIWLDVGEGPSIQYDGLHVLDADGIELDARMEVDGDRIRVIADVTGARWPVVVDPVVTTAEWMGVGSSDWDKYGHSLASGDFNGDSWPDLVVGAPHNWGCPSDSTSGIGKVHVIYGSEDGLGEDTSLPATTISAPSTATCFADELASGDFDADGYTDLAIGSPGNCSFRGSVYIHKGTSSGLSTTISTTLNGISSNDLFGRDMSTGDLFGDGYMDLAIGADQNLSTTRVGYMRLYRGSTMGLCRSIYGTTSLGRFGEEVELADLNGDGKAELLVGAVNAKRVYKYTVTSCSTAPVATELTAPSGLLYFGSEVEVLYNGSTYPADIVVSGETSGGVGRVYRYLTGSPTASSYLTDSTASTEFGGNLQAVDLDLDGYTDLAVGARLADSGAGRVYVYDNSAGSLSLGTTLVGPIASGNFGDELARMDDQGHSGASESLVVGAQSSSSMVGAVLKDNNGAAYIYTGY